MAVCWVSRAALLVPVEDDDDRDSDGEALLVAWDFEGLDEAADEEEPAPALAVDVELPVD